VTARQARARRRRRDAAEPARDGYRPAEGTPLVTCECGAAFVDDPPSRRAYLIVFGHRPRPQPKPGPRPGQG